MSFATLAELSKGGPDGMIPFSLGELYGPIKCEHDGCGDESWFIWMTPEEYAMAKEQGNPTLHVFENKIGTAMCKKHARVVER